jgi:hypothetical protein
MAVQQLAQELKELGVALLLDQLDQSRAQLQSGHGAGVVEQS